MYFQYWGRVRFTALNRDLRIYMQATGWSKMYVLESGKNLSLFAYMADGKRFSVLVPIGGSAELEVVIHSYGSEALHEGTRWSIQYRPEEVLGSCEMIELLGKWRNEAEVPSRLREPGGSFFRI